ncbi:MAG TPA: hypothetical protein ENN67_00040 [Firmicutes bacterium]|nr:hypothetical protein [Bacillota bacterium]
MKVEHINPFIESVSDLFTTMLGAEVSRGEIGVLKEIPPNRDIVALVELNGSTRGIVAISFPVGTALAMVGRMQGSEVRFVDETVRDSVIELVNLITSGAKSKLSGDGKGFNFGNPSIVRGNSYSVDPHTHSTWLDVPFTSELGDFCIRMTFEL